MNCLLIGSFTFPYGMPSSARIKNLAYGLQHAGANVYVYSLAPAPGEKQTASEWIKLDERIYYHHSIEELSSDSWSKPSKRPLYLLKTQLNSFSKFKKITTDLQFDFVFIYGRGFIPFFQFMNYFSQKKIKTVLDVVELPALYKNWYELLIHPLRLDSILGENVLSKKATLISCITTSIQKRFPNQKTYLLPGIEDWENIASHDLTVENTAFTFLYLGIFIDKDNPQKMFDFCQKLEERNQDFIIKIAGRYNHYAEGGRWAKKFVDAFSDKVILLGELNNDQLKTEIISSDSILLFRQDNASEENTFPTRLVEYLRYSKLVVTSPKGDMEKYLTHSKDVFFIPYSISDMIIDEIIELMKHPEKAYEIGRSGFISGKNNFDRNEHAIKLIQRIKSDNNEIK